MKAYLITDRIISSETEPLTSVDEQMLKKEIWIQLRIILPAYFVFVLIIAYLFAEGPQSLNTGARIRRLEINERQTQLFWEVLPYFSAVVFLMATAYLTWYYFQNVKPLVLDLKNKTKQLAFFKPDKTDMSAFNRYYITIPIRRDQLLELTAEDFYLINDNYLLCLEIGPSSQYILRLKYGEKEIQFFRKEAT